MVSGSRVAEVALLASLLEVFGCSGEERQTARPDPSGRPALAAEAVKTEVELALKRRGIGSKAELDRALAKLPDAATRAVFEEGFRGCFVQDRSKRAYETSVTTMTEVLQTVPRFAPAYRVLAYARLNLVFDMQGATQLYEKAVAADPDYGEAHYGLSFMLTQFDMDRGREHFDRAMELGVPDEQSLALEYYRGNGAEPR